MRRTLALCDGHWLYATDIGHLVKGPVMFKRGEVIGVAKAHFSKFFLAHFEEVTGGGVVDEAVPMPAVRKMPARKPRHK
jgi:hypothetical protein